MTLTQSVSSERMACAVDAAVPLGDLMRRQRTKRSARSRTIPTASLASGQTGSETPSDALSAATESAVREVRGNARQFLSIREDSAAKLTHYSAIGSVDLS